MNNFVVFLQRTKRKFVDVSKRLENLFDCLRDGRVRYIKFNVASSLRDEGICHMLRLNL